MTHKIQIQRKQRNCQHKCNDEKQLRESKTHGEKRDARVRSGDSTLDLALGSSRVSHRAIVRKSPVQLRQTERKQR